MAELADAEDLKSFGVIRAGSSPATRTKRVKETIMFKWFFHKCKSCRKHHKYLYYHGDGYYCNPCIGERISGRR